MRSITHLLTRQLGVLGAILALATAAPVVASEITPWKALATSGPVSRQMSASAEDTWAAVRRGDSLEPLTMLRTGKRGRATLSRYSSVLIVDPQSELELPAEGGNSPVRQTSGSVVYDIETGGNGTFAVETPYLVAGVKGTVFGVTVTEHYTLVSVEEGLVEVRDSAGQRALELRAGDAVMVDAFDHDLERVRQGDALDRERQRTDKTRDRMHRRLRQDTDVADRRSDRRRRDHGTDEYDDKRDADDRKMDVASNEDGDSGNRDNEDDNLDEDFDELDDLDDAAEDDDDLKDELNDEDARQDAQDDLKERGDPEDNGSQGTNSN